GPSVPTTPFLVTVDTTAPVVGLYVDATTTNDTTPLVRVNATDANLGTSTTLTLDIDTNNHGDFLDAGESGYATATLHIGHAVSLLSPALAVGTVQMRARVSDLAGNQGTSATVSLTVSSSGSSFPATDRTALSNAISPGFVPGVFDPPAPWPGFPPLIWI